MKNFLIAFIKLLLLVYITFGVVLFINQRDLLYAPTDKINHLFNEVIFHNDKESINVIVLHEGHENAILYFGGNGESMAQSSDYIAGQFPDFTVYLMDYRGYGQSTGESSEKALYSDALKLYDKIKPKHDRISIGGRSLGTGISTYVAANREVSKLALITPFDSIVNIAQGRYPMYPISLLLDDSYDSVSRVKQIRAKTLIVIAEFDRVVPKESTQKLIDAFDPEQLEVIVIKNRGHIDISSDKRYYKIMQEFIGEG